MSVAYSCFETQCNNDNNNDASGVGSP